ncbi:MAG: GNAT family N-acetyltransferase [Caldilineaceae bacterium]|nr:GNAT family N-acetyltransferase [Caldilineaceae bacterium]
MASRAPLPASVQDQIQIAPLAPFHAEEAARLHILGQPGTFLTALGPGVLTVLYRVLPVSPVGFGFAALDEKGHPLAFAAITTGTGRLFFEMGTRRLLDLLPPLLSRFVQDPRLIGRSIQTVLYPFLAHERETERAAELLAIMTAPKWRGRGLGAMLLAAVEESCRQRQIPLLDVTVDANNSGARRFYERQGFAFRREMMLYARPMALYRREIAPS